MSEDLRAKYDSLVRKKDQLRQEADEAKTQLRISQARVEEVAAEAKTLGFDTIEALNEAVVREEAAILADLVNLEKVLNQEVVPVVQIAQPTTTTKITSLDDVLNLGVNT
jgi:phosphosulfolactate synthase (CoM biosynthesis protein A)